MVKNLSYALGTFYTFVICVSIFTTLISTAYGAAKFLEKKIRFSFALLLVLGASFSVGLFGFGNLIDWLYPIVGFVCFVFLVFLYVKNRKMV